MQVFTLLKGTNNYCQCADIPDQTNMLEEELSNNPSLRSQASNILKRKKNTYFTWKGIFLKECANICVSLITLALFFCITIWYITQKCFLFDQYYGKSYVSY